MRSMNITKKCYETYENNIIEVLKSDNKIIIRDKKTDRYYEENELSRCNFPWAKYNPSIKNYRIYSRIVFTIIFFIINILLYINPNPLSNVDIKLFIICSTVYTVLQVFGHETFHIIALHQAGRKIDKMGFRLNYIFPAFYIRMNQMYMLSDFEKIYIHSAGLFFNCISNGIILFVSQLLNLELLNKISKFFVIGIFMNIFPILNSNGYKIMLTIFSYNEYRQNKHNNVFIKIISYINIFISTIYFFSFVL